jgi:SAM-dependent methyltransferase
MSKNISQFNKFAGATSAMAVVMRAFLSLILDPHGRNSFLIRLKRGCSILDVGCGNDSPFNTKKIRPDCLYTGLDIDDYNLTKLNIADHYILCRPEDFAANIAKFAGQFDAVISCHNLEHCNDRRSTVSAMVEALKPGGVLYLGFPSERSVRLPSRGGCLNYYDDPTHKDAPPDVDAIVGELTRAGLSVRCYNPDRPPLYRFVGLIFEPLSRIRNKVMLGTWALYGFETRIWAVRPEATP